MIFLSWRDMTGQQWCTLPEEERIPANFDRAPDGRDLHPTAVCGSLAGELARGELLEQGQGEKVNPPSPMHVDLTG